MTTPRHPDLTTPSCGHSLASRFGLLCLVGALGCTPGGAQTIGSLRNQLSDDARSRGGGSMVQGVAGFRAVAGISGASFKVDESGAADETDLKALVLHGYHDMGANYFLSRYLLEQSVRSPDARSRVSFHTYPGGHMFYLRKNSRAACAADVRGFFEAAP